MSRCAVASYDLSVTLSDTGTNTGSNHSNTAAGENAAPCKDDRGVWWEREAEESSDWVRDVSMMSGPSSINKYVLQFKMRRRRVRGNFWSEKHNGCKITSKKSSSDALQRASVFISRFQNQCLLPRATPKRLQQHTWTWDSFTSHLTEFPTQSNSMELYDVLLQVLCATSVQKRKKRHFWLLVSTIERDLLMIHEWWWQSTRRRSRAYISSTLTACRFSANIKRQTTDILWGYVRCELIKLQHIHRIGRRHVGNIMVTKTQFSTSRWQLWTVCDSICQTGATDLDRKKFLHDVTVTCRQAASSVTVSTYCMQHHLQ